LHVVAHQTLVLLQLQDFTPLVSPRTPRVQHDQATHSTELDELSLDLVYEDVVERCVGDEVDDFLLIGLSIPIRTKTSQRTNLDAIPDNVDLHEPVRDLQFGGQPDTEDANVDESDDSEDEPAQDVLRPK